MTHSTAAKIAQIVLGLACLACVIACIAVVCKAGTVDSCTLLTSEYTILGTTANTVSPTSNTTFTSRDQVTVKSADITPLSGVTLGTSDTYYVYIKPGTTNWGVYNTTPPTVADVGLTGGLGGGAALCLVLCVGVHLFWR